MTMPDSGRSLVLFLTCEALLSLPVYAEEPAQRIQEIKPSLQKVQEPKTQEPKNDTAVPELKQDTKNKEPNEPAQNKPVRSLVLTVKLALLSDQRTAASKIEVDHKGADIILSGKVASETEKVSATDLARQVEGVKSVINKIEVVTELHQLMSQKHDQAIIDYVRERFKKSATLEAARFDIKTENGVVELTGKTRFQVIVLEAAETALQVPGVKAVKTQAVRIEGAE